MPLLNSNKMCLTCQPIRVVACASYTHIDGEILDYHRTAGACRCDSDNDCECFRNDICQCGQVATQIILVCANTREVILSHPITSHVIFACANYICEVGEPLPLHRSAANCPCGNYDDNGNCEHRTETLTCQCGRPATQCVVLDSQGIVFRLVPLLETETQ